MRRDERFEFLHAGFGGPARVHLIEDQDHGILQARFQVGQRRLQRGSVGGFVADGVTDGGGAASRSPAAARRAAICSCKATMVAPTLRSSAFSPSMTWRICQTSLSRMAQLLLQPF